MTAIAPPGPLLLSGFTGRVRGVWTSASPPAQLARFTVLGGLANGMYLGTVWSGAAAGADVQILNAVGTVGSTVLANELHRRYTFRAVGRSSALAVHLAGSGTAVIGLVASAAALAGYQLVSPQGPPENAAAVGVTVSVAVGLARFLVLRTVSARTSPGGGTGRRGRRGPPTVVVRGVVVGGLMILPLGGGVCAASTLEGGRHTPIQVAGTDAGPAPVPSTASLAPRDIVLAARDAFAAGGTGGTLAVLVTDGAAAPVVGTTPDSVAREVSRHEAGWLPDRPFPTASLVKLYLAEGILHQARLTGVPLPESDGALIDAMLTRSDDDAASRLWVRYDGPAQIVSVAQRYGLSSTAPPAERGAWGQAVTSARDLGRFLTALPRQAHRDDAARVLDPLARATPVGADGFDQRFGLLAPGATPPGTPVKQGWMCCVDRARHLHSVGMVGNRAVILLSEAPAGTGWTRLRAGLDGAALAAFAPLAR